MSRVKKASRVRRLASAALATAAAVSAGLLALTAPAASASSQVGWIQLAHFSPNTPGVDVYLYSFGNSTAQIVLKHVTYGTVSPFEQVAAGDYTVAMRLAGAAPKSKPVLSTAVDVAAGHAYTVAGVGPASGIRLQIIPDRLTTPTGKSLVRVIQASMNQDTVTVTAAHKSLAAGLRFANVSRYRTVSPGTWTVTAKGPSQTATSTITLAAGTIHTLVILDDPGKLVIDDLLEAAGSQVAPAGGAGTGFGGTAAQPGASLRPWLAAATAGVVSIAGGIVFLSRRRRPALHARRPVRSA
jgi:Domain of unknown function (DUF4397)